MDITTELLKGVSPFLSEINYSVTYRKLVLVAVDDPEKMNPLVRVVFPEVINYSEEVDEIDDELVDSVIGIHWVHHDEICIKTDTREINITLFGKPYAESIT